MKKDLRFHDDLDHFAFLFSPQDVRRRLPHIKKDDSSERL